MAKRAKAVKPSVTLTTEDYQVYCSREGLIHVDMLTGPGAPLQLTFEDPEGAYDYAHAILRAYDAVNGT